MQSKRCLHLSHFLFEKNELKYKRKGSQIEIQETTFEQKENIFSYCEVD